MSLGSGRDQLKIAADVVELPGSSSDRCCSRSLSVELPKTSLRCRDRSRALADPRRAAVDVVELQGRCRAVVAPPVVPRAAVDVVEVPGSSSNCHGALHSP